MIWFVGAGCYHPDYLTIAAKKIIETADCILYDALINKEFLQLAKPSCECLCVGKRGHATSSKQEDINELLLKKSKQYAQVLRLKGGDPFLFGRGSEEMLHVLEHGIDCQYIPGISSAIGALGFAGIPVTQRHVSSGVHIHTLHKQDGSDQLDYDLIARDPNTHLFFMGAHKIKKMVQHCLDAGIPNKYPIAIASHCTYPNQKVLCSTLEEILNLDVSSYTSPLLIVLGPVIQNQSLLNNASRLDCFSKRVLFTSIDDTKWPIDLLSLTHGIYPFIRQVGHIQYQYDPYVSFQSYQSLVFSSKHAVIGFFQYLIKQQIDIRSLSDIKFYCIGKKTEEQLLQHGIFPTATTMCRDDMIHLLQNESNVCYIGGKQTQSTWPTFQTYQIKAHDFDLPQESVDAICVTCPFAIEQLVKKQIDRTIPLFCFGHQSYQAAKSHQFTSIHVVSSNKKEMVQQVIQFFQGEKS